MNFNRSDLLYNDYSWSAKPEGDNPKITGVPDSTLLDRNEGYEVLYMINAIIKQHFNGSTNYKGTGQHIEKLIRKCPTHIRSQAGIKQWIMGNWSY